MTYLKFDPTKPDGFVIVEEIYYNNYNGYKIGDIYYSKYPDSDGFEPYKITDLKTETNNPEKFMITILQGQRIVSYLEKDFKKCYKSLKQYRLEKINQINGKFRSN